MYSDPSLIRKHTVKLSFNDNEAALVDALVRYTGEEKAAFIRGLILQRAEEVLCHASESAVATFPMPRAQQAMFGA
jgi:hypothetical protein